jgi:hypothetical protein
VQGFESIQYLHTPSGPVLLGMCEGNHCAGGAKGRDAGNGRIIVSQLKESRWVEVVAGRPHEGCVGGCLIVVGVGVRTTSNPGLLQPAAAAALSVDLPVEAACRAPFKLVVLLAD